jgi:hypothetical protein
MADAVLRLMGEDDWAGTPPEDAPRLFRIFLQDHLAALKAGCALVQRTLRENRDTPLGRVLAPLHVGLAEDLVHVRDIAEAAEIRPARAKEAMAWSLERVGRMKLNGRVRRYSPLSRVVELEGLVILSAQRVAMWRVLERRAARDPKLRVVDFASRADLAERQREILSREVVRAAAAAF